MEELLKDFMGKIDNQFELMGKRFDGIDQRLDGIDARLDRVDGRLETINNHATEFRSHFKQIHTKLDGHEKVFNVIADEITGIKFDIAHLSAKSGIHETEISTIKKRMQL
ncbi:hypothetical protein [Neobacillus sp. YIM B06451]|uniref:hypothetical protein n=1 Tax=Neobacillus sp. YIM B06451 TaxID=3070994 RepID=UPI0029318B56|nr:hypothetical protein [Neobacillus sp. YIM B06451]